MTYDAFISYSHAADDHLAPALQDGMQRLGKPWYRRRALHVFRDETGLSTNPHLWSSIEAALDASSWFVLFASPASASSEWVRREIEFWIATKSVETILPVVTDGDWYWNAATNSLDGDAVPGPLRAAMVAEPRHLDLRWAHRETQTDLRNARFRDAVAQIAAPIHGLSKDDLESEDVRQHRRTMRTTRAVAAALAILTAAAVVAAFAATSNARKARRARDESDYQRIVAQSGNLKVTNRQLALLLAVEARHLRDTPQSQGALQAALTEDPRYLGTMTDPDNQSSVQGLCPLAGNRDLLVTSRDGTIEWVHTETRQGLGQRTRLVAADARIVRSVDSPRSALGCAVSRSGATVAVFSVNGSVFTLDPGTHAVRSAVQTGRELNDVAVAPNGHTIAVGTDDGKVLVWPTGNLNAAPRMLDSGNTAVAVAFTPDGNTLATTTPNQILLRNTTTLAQRGTIEDPPSNYETAGLVALPEPFRMIRFSADGRSLADGRRAETRTFDLAAGKMRWTLYSNTTGGEPVAFGPKDGSLYTIGADNTVTRYDVTTGAPTGPPFRTEVFGLALSPDGSTLFAAGQGSSVDLWALDGRNVIARVVGTPGQVPVGYSPDGRTLLTRGDSASQIIAATDAWDVATGRHLGHVPTAAFPQLLDEHTAAGYFIDRLSVDRIDLRTGRFVGPRIPVEVAGVVQAGNDTAGNLVVAHADGSIDRYLPNGTKIGTPWLKLNLAPYTIAISPRGLVAMSTDDARTLIYDLKTSKPAYPPIDDLQGATFSPDGNLLGGLSRSGTFVVLDARSGAPTGAHISHPGSDFYFGSFDRRGTLMLGAPASAQLYNLRTGQPIGERFPSTRDPVLRADGLELATSTANGVLLWDLDPNHWERAACKLAGRNLTHDEWITYFPNAGSYRATCAEWPPTP